MAETDFNNFYLANLNVYEVADGLIPEIAERLDVKLGDEPNSSALGELVGKIGTNKVLRDNAEVTAIDRDTAVDFVERSGVQQEMYRSLWTPEINADDVDAAVLTGAVANWQDRGVQIVESNIPVDTPIYIATGSRVMDSATEQSNTNVKLFFEKHSRFPSETEYAGRMVVGHLRREAGYSVFWPPFGYGASAGDQLAADFFKRNSGLLDKKLAFVRVANAGVQLAVQMRKAARIQSPTFDTDPMYPQVFVITDDWPLARTDKQDDDPAHYQKAATALRQVALTAKMLHETAGGE